MRTMPSCCQTFLSLHTGVSLGIITGLAICLNVTPPGALFDGRFDMPDREIRDVHADWRQWFAEVSWPAFRPATMRLPSRLTMPRYMPMVSR